MAEERAIIHVDMDAFYASVEQRDAPELRGKPVVVGGTGPRGVVAAASYEVRQYGVHSAMPMREALRRCPDAICVRPRMARYREVSGHVFSIFRRYTPIVQGLSLDEAYLDVTDAQALFGNAERIGRHIKADIATATHLSASVGIAPNMLLAKIASDMNKPNGFTHITAKRAIQVLDPLPATSIGGIGPRTGKRLEAAGIRSLRDLRMASDSRLRPIFGRYTPRMQERAMGLDDRPVTTESPDKSISAEETFDIDIADRDTLSRILLQLTDKVATRVRRKQLVAGVVKVKIRRADFRTFTRQRQITPATHDTSGLHAVSLALLDEWLADNPGVRVRLLGMGVADLSDSVQLGLFDDGPSSRLDETVDRIRERFGPDLLRRGGDLD